MLPSMTRRAQSEESKALDTQARQQIAAAIRDGRKQAQLTLEELAARVGFLSYKPMWLIEHGRMPIPPESIGRLEQVLGLPPRSLFWAECRCRLLRMGFDLDAALEATEGPAEPAPARSAPATAEDPALHPVADPPAMA